ncbi:MAG: oligoribonuclease [Pseudomonadota bacterium]|nr:oligoribonuclease [Pseudomonadota bacterium]
MGRKNSSHLIWIDLEMTGLDPEKERIIEIATIVTDAQLNVLEEGPSLVVHQKNELLDAMDEWNTRQHGSTGLTDRVRKSRMSEREAEEQTLVFLEKWLPEGKSPMCGNSVHQDRRFLNKYMPRLERFFHYRNIDVSTIKELAVRWKPEITQGFEKQGNHLAMDDIRDSINELKYYRELFIRG